ncbi:ATPase domain-containing protein [uncultured Paludibaculum sp.]|uniref:RAD55 family ATPase n=1 Tax=uncultured Paludibaculum sp. TaxID=1765020 RepID=UPI002AAA7220|nr:ATPase domain-containing protein [uncultured Paludibaculum sp.]
MAAGPGSYREALQQLIEGLNRVQLTTMLSHEIGSYPDTLLTLEATGSLVDTAIRLRRTLLTRRVLRTVELVKSRGQDYDHGEHTLEIVDGKGLQVFRRVQAPPRMKFDQHTSKARRSAIGVEALDTLLGGGMLDGSTTMVVGLSGVGKTVLGTQLLRKGAIKRNLKGLLISLDEHPAKIVRTIEEHHIQRMVIDGMTSYSTALADQAVYRDFFHALVAYSKHRLMTTFFSYENPEFLGLSSFMPDLPVSSIVDNIILLSLVGINSSLRRRLTVVKSRGSKHEIDSRAYVIGQDGLSLLPFDEQVASVQPLSKYSGILSRAPSRLTVPVLPLNGV